jgi:hypothetical protein
VGAIDQRHVGSGRVDLLARAQRLNDRDGLAAAVADDVLAALPGPAELLRGEAGKAADDRRDHGDRNPGRVVRLGDAIGARAGDCGADRGAPAGRLLGVKARDLDLPRGDHVASSTRMIVSVSFGV